MNTIKQKHKEMVTLATPYYGSMIRPHGRPEQIYIKLIANPTTGEFNQTEVCVWDPKKLPDLPIWLSKQGIDTLLCDDSPQESDQHFSAAGISIFRKQWEGLQEMVSDWTTQIATGGSVLTA
jgi:hypothetical protein